MQCQFLWSSWCLWQSFFQQVMHMHSQVWAQLLEIKLGWIIWFDLRNRRAIQRMNQVASRFANQPMIKWLMIKQQFQDWNGMLSFLIRAPWSESLSLNNEVNNCLCVCVCVCVFVPLQIIMRTLFRLIICTFCYDISFKCWIFQNPMVFPPQFFGFYGVPMYIESYNFYHSDTFIYLLLLLTFYVSNWGPMCVIS